MSSVCSSRGRFHKKRLRHKVILKRKKKPVIVKCYRKTLWLLPKTKQGKSRNESQISSPASILVVFFKNTHV